MERPHVGEGSVGFRGNCLRVSYLGQRRLERKHKRDQDHMQDGHETRLDLDKDSLQGERLVSYVPEHSYCSDWD